MAERIASLYAEIGADTSGVEKGLADTKQGLGDLSGAFESVTGVSLSATAAFTAVGAGLKYSIDAAAEAERVMAQTEAVIKSTGGAAGISAGEVASLASSLSQVSTFEDEAIQKGENLLLTFTNIGKDVFPQATKTMLDMATAMGTDAAGGAIQLGKALNDPVAGITALTRVGVTFTQQQKDQIKNYVEMGQVVKAQQIILDELNKEFGGSAAAAADTYSGKLEILQNNIGNLAEAIGAELLPPLTEATTALNLLLTWNENITTAISGHADEVARSSVTYDEYVTELQRVAKANDLVIAQNGDLIRLHVGSASATAEVVQENYLLSELQRKIAQEVPVITGETYRLNEAYQTSTPTVEMYAQQQAVAAEKARLLAEYQAAVRAEFEQTVAQADAFREAMGTQIAGALEAAGVKAGELRAGLGLIDELFGTTEQSAYDMKTAIDEATAEFKKTGDKEEYKRDLEDIAIAFGSAGDAARIAAGYMADFYTNLDKIPTEREINIIFNYASPAAQQDFAEQHTGNRRAVGGPVRAGEPYLVGERGPEIMVPKSDGQIIPNNEIGQFGQSMAGGLFAGATIVLRNEMDIEILAQKIATYWGGGLVV